MTSLPFPCGIGIITHLLASGGFIQQCRSSLLVLALALAGPVCAKEAPDLELLVFDADTATELTQLPHEHPLAVRAAMEQSVRRQFNSGDATNTDTIAALEAALKLQELKGNAYDKSLAEILQDLGTAHEKNGEFAQALASFQRANHIIRVNSGLFSLDQTPLLQHMINDNLALGDFAATDAEQEYLYYLRTKAYDKESIELIPALQDFAAWHVRAARVYLAPALAGNSGFNIQFADTVQDQFDLRVRHLQQAQLLYQRVIDILLAHGDKTGQRLASAELSLATSNFFTTRQLITYNQTHVLKDHFADPFPEIDLREYHSSFTDGRVALESRVKILAESAATTTPADLAYARLDLIDWLIATGSSVDIKPMLEMAWQDYVASGASAAEIDALFNPALPVSVPVFEIKPNTRASLGITGDMAIDYHGYIDVDYSVDVGGEAAAPKILQSTADTPQEVADILIQSITNSKFRPRILDGKTAPYDHVVVRYHYAW